MRLSDARPDDAAPAGVDGRRVAVAGRNDAGPAFQEEPSRDASSAPAALGVTWPGVAGAPEAMAVCDVCGLVSRLPSPPVCPACGGGYG
jgi:hypothetical protein